MTFLKSKFKFWASVLAVILHLSTGVLSQACGASAPCEVGCCSKFGFCGFGKDFCAKEVCVNNCERKADCDPGGLGADFVEREKCPLNVCCSKYGYCGTTEDFCGNKKPKRPSCSTELHKLERVVGYYEGWSPGRPCNQFYPEQIPLGVYTHLNFAFATINPESFELQPGSSADKELYQRLTYLKTLDPDLKVFIAVGGWTFNDPGPTARVFSDIISDSSKSDKFITSVVKFLNTYDFDGIDLDWEYPGAKDRSGRDGDYENFPKFMKKLKAALKTTGGRDGVSITLPASFWYLQHFDIKALEPHVDFFNMMTYDFHGTWDMTNKWVGPYLNAHTNLTEIKDALDLLWRNDLDSGKVVLGMAFYGRAFTLADRSCNKPGCTYASGASKLACSGEISVALNSEIEEIIEKTGSKPVLYKDAAVKVLQYNDNQWVSYDDSDTFQTRADFARSQCLGGVMVWAVSHDNVDATNSWAIKQATSGRRTSLINLALHDGSSGYDTVTQYHDQCKWTNCLEECPSGWVRMKRNDGDARKDEYLINLQNCNGHGQRQLCCPPDQELPSCGWYKHNNGNCDSTDLPITAIEIGSTSWHCNSGYQAAACGVTPKSMHTWNTCTWSKDWPKCNDGTCPSGFDSVFESNSGSGGAECKRWVTTWRVGAYVWDNRKYCCDTRDERTWADCDWYENAGTLPEGLSKGTCMGGCPSDKYAVSLHLGGGSCKNGARAKCCSSKYKTITKRRSSADDEFDYALNQFVTWDDGCTADKATPMYHTQLTVIGNLKKLLFGVHQQSTVDIWNSRVGLRYANLDIKTLSSWVRQDKVASHLGSAKFPERLVCGLSLYNDRIGEKEVLKCECDHDGCCMAKLCPRSAQENLVARGLGLIESPSANSTDELRGIWARAEETDGNDLEERADGGSYEYSAFSPYVNTVVTGVVNGIAYVSRGKWKAGDDIFNRGLDFASTTCDDIDVLQVTLTTVTVKSMNFVTEHIFERQTFRDFIQATIGDKLPGNHNSQYGPIDPSFRTSTVLQTITGPATGGFVNNHINNMMNALGSKYNTRPFVLCGSKLNNNKLQLWGTNQPVGDSTIRPYRLDTSKPSAYINQIRGPISALMYLNNPVIRDALLIIIKDIQAHLSLAEAAHLAATGVNVQAVKRFNEWAGYFFANMVSRTQVWIKAEVGEGKTLYKTVKGATGTATVATLTSLWYLLSDFEVDEAILAAIK